MSQQNKYTLRHHQSSCFESFDRVCFVVKQMLSAGVPWKEGWNIYRIFPTLCSWQCCCCTADNIGDTMPRGQMGLRARYQSINQSSNGDFPPIGHGEPWICMSFCTLATCTLGNLQFVGCDSSAPVLAVDSHTCIYFFPIPLLLLSTTGLLADITKMDCSQFIEYCQWYVSLQSGKQFWRYEADSFLLFGGDFDYGGSSMHCCHLMSFVGLIEKDTTTPGIELLE